MVTFRSALMDVLTVSYDGVKAKSTSRSATELYNSVLTPTNLATFDGRFILHVGQKFSSLKVDTRALIVT